MERISLAVKKSNLESESNPQELLSVLNYYYNRDHFRAWIVSTLLLEMELPPHLLDEVELKLSVSAYHCGLHTIGIKYANTLLEKYPDSPIYKHNVDSFEEIMDKSYDYCLLIWKGSFNWFIDLARALKFKLEKLGYSAVISEELLASRKTIVFGSNASISISQEIPADAIIYNLEHLYDGSPWDHPEYHKVLRDREVWDFSSNNISWLKEKGLGKKWKNVKLNYAPTLEFCRDAFLDIQEDIDILFIGWINERRQAIYNQLKIRNPELNVVFTSSSWGIERDELVARAKVVLNIHYYETGILETPRISYLVANKKLVISESSCREDEQDWPGVIFVSYERIAETAVLYVNQPESRKKPIEHAYVHFTKKNHEPIS